MRVNVYAEELPEEGEISIIGKEIEGQVFTGLRIPLYLPVTLPDGTQARGKFMHHPDDDDSAAITIWGKRDLRMLLQEALRQLNDHYESSEHQNRWLHAYKQHIYARTALEGQELETFVGHESSGWFEQDLWLETDPDEAADVDMSNWDWLANATGERL